MSKSKAEQAQAAYDQARAEFLSARARVTKARRDLEHAQGKAPSPEQREAQRQAGRRAHYLFKHPELRKLRGKSRRDALDAIIATKDRACVWRVYLDTMHHDPITRAPRIYAKNPKRFELYKAGLTLAMQMWRAQRSIAANKADLSEANQLRDNARTLELHLQGLVDVSPRAVEIHYPTEWKVISKALRPEGMNPKSKGAQRLLALYQHIVRTHTTEDV